MPLPNIVARYGGEEFAVILPDTGRELAVGMAEKIRKAVEEMNPVYGETKVRLTVSIGVSFSECLRSDKSAEKLIQEADDNLYKAKNNGRNQVMV